MNAKHASLLTQCRADTAGELREVGGLRKTVVSVLPLALTDQIIPFRNHVAERAAGHTERGAAIHATCGLFAGPRLQTGFGVHVEPVLDTFLDGAFSQLAAGTDFQESSWVAHVSALLP